MTPSESILIILPKIFGYIFHTFTSPLIYTYDLTLYPQDQLTGNLLKEDRKFHLFCMSDFHKRKKEGWKQAIGRDEFMRPIRYFDKSKKLTLMYKDEVQINEPFTIIDASTTRDKKSSLFIAWILQCIATMPHYLMDSELHRQSSFFVALTVLLAIINAGLPIYALKNIRTINSIATQLNNQIFTAINAWGYFWRCFLIMLLSALLVAAAAVVFPIFNGEEQHSIGKTIKLEALYIIGISLSTYFLYCKNKLDLLYSALKTFRGY
jgi:hypothetical protein